MPRHELVRYLEKHQNFLFGYSDQVDGLVLKHKEEKIEFFINKGGNVNVIKNHQEIDHFTISKNSTVSDTVESCLEWINNYKQEDV